MWHDRGTHRGATGLEGAHALRALTSGAIRHLEVARAHVATRIRPNRHTTELAVGRGLARRGPGLLNLSLCRPSAMSGTVQGTTDSKPRTTYSPIRRASPAPQLRWHRRVKPDWNRPQIHPLRRKSPQRFQGPATASRRAPLPTDRRRLSRAFPRARCSFGIDPTKELGDPKCLT